MTFDKRFGAALIVALMSFNGATFAYTAADCRVDNSQIVNDILVKISSINTVSTSNINVTSQNCVVTLSGNLKTDEEATVAIEMAASTPGVLYVDTTQLMVSDSKQPITDAYITALIKGSFSRERTFGDRPLSASDIRVETKNGVVYLSGTADAEQAKNAENFAAALKGVTRVESKFNIVPREQRN